MIPDEVIERVRDSADIVAIIGEYVPLKRVGADYRGPCPFHQGKHRNFSVSPRRNMYHCFVCHEGGDVFSFLQKQLGLEWPAAVRQVAEKVGIEIPDDRQRREGPDPREPFWEMNAAAAEYFSRFLWEETAGAEARGYLERRGVSREIAERYDLGFAPRDAVALRAHLNTLGFADDRLVEGGLLVVREEPGEPRPRFRNRLIFPILDGAGRYVGFGGRLLGPGEPKYLNSAESAVFSKGKLLYGLYWARGAIRKEERAILVEGYFDVVRMLAAGIEPVVAPLGTALTEQQAALLRRYTKSVILLYDSDDAGLKATFRAGDALLGQGVRVQVASLPQGEDPDSFVGRAGPEQMRQLLAESIDVFDRKIQLLERRGYFADLRRRRLALDGVIPTIRAASDPLTRDLYLSRASEASGVRIELLRQEVEAGGGIIPAGRADGETGAAPTGHRPPHADPAARRKERRTIPGEPAERAILTAMLQLRGGGDAVGERVGERDFRVPEYRVLFRMLLDSSSEDALANMLSNLSEELVPVVEELQAGGASITDVPRTLDDSIRKLEIRRLETRSAQIDKEMRVATEGEKDQLLREKHDLSKSLKEYGAIGRRYGKSQL